MEAISFYNHIWFFPNVVIKDIADSRKMVDKNAQAICFKLFKMRVELMKTQAIKVPFLLREPA
jgi:hypothetical protein